jgi:hypothetical protein
MEYQDFSPPLKYGATFGQSIVNTNANDSTFATIGVGLPFITTASFGTLDLNSGALGGALITDAQLTNIASGKYVYVTGFSVKCFQSAGGGASGGSYWQGGTLSIQDTAGTVIWSFAPGVISHEYGATASGSALLYSKTMCGGVNRGIYLFPSGGSITTNGGTLVATVWGYIK